MKLSTVSVISTYGTEREQNKQKVIKIMGGFINSKIIARVSKWATTERFRITLEGVDWRISLSGDHFFTRFDLVVFASWLPLALTATEICACELCGATFISSSIVVMR